MTAQQRTGVRAALVEETGERPSGGGAGAVVIARVDDPSKLLDGGSRRLHGDVIESLVDLAVALLEEELHEGQSP